MKKIITLLFTIMLLTACSETTNNDYIFSGESENWEAEFTYNGTEIWKEKNGIKTYTNEDRHWFVLKYKGSLEKLSSLQSSNIRMKQILVVRTKSNSLQNHFKQSYFRIQALQKVRQR